MSVIHYNGKNVKTPRARRATTRPRPSPMTNRPARPLPQSPIPHDEPPSSPRRRTSPFPAAPHHPAVATPSTRRPGAGSRPGAAPRPLGFRSSAAPHRDLSYPRPGAAPSHRRRRSHPPGAPGAAPSSQRGAPSFRRPTLLPTGLRPLPKRFSSPGRDPFCSAIPPVADPGTGAARGRLLANPCVSPHSTRHRSVLPSLFHETDPSSHRRRSSSACLRIR